MKETLVECAERGDVSGFTIKLKESLDSYLGQFFAPTRTTPFEELELHIITSAKMYGAKDNGQMIEGNLVLQFIYPEQVKHFLQWLSNYNSNLNYSIQPAYDKVVGNVVEVVISFADAQF